MKKKLGTKYQKLLLQFFSNASPENGGFKPGRICQTHTKGMPAIEGQRVDKEWTGINLKPLIQNLSKSYPEILLQPYSNVTPIFGTFSLRTVSQRLPITFPEKVGQSVGEMWVELHQPYTNVAPAFSLILLKSLFMLCVAKLL